MFSRPRLQYRDDAVKRSVKREEDEEEGKKRKDRKSGSNNQEGRVAKCHHYDLEIS